jgi:hypothetical protein
LGEIDDLSPPAPLPWEQKAAIGSLGLLALQEIHEGVLYCLGQSAPATDRIHSGWMILLLIYFSVGLGLLNRSQIAWWFGLILIGGTAFLHLADTWGSIVYTYQTRPGEIAYLDIVEHFRDRRLEPFEMFWLIARNLLLFAVPALLFLGEVRKMVQQR